MQKGRADIVFQVHSLQTRLQNLSLRSLGNRPLYHDRIARGAGRLRRTVETVAFRDGDGAVIDPVIVLGLHRDGQCQYQQQRQQSPGEGGR